MRTARGIALVTTLLLTAVVAIVVLGASYSALVNRQTTGQQYGANAAYYLAQAGINDYKTKVFRNLVSFYDENQAGWCESPLADGIRDEFGNVILPPGVMSTPVAIGLGTYSVQFDITGQHLVITAVGTVGPSQTVLQLVATAGGGPASAWDNAIMARGYLGGKNTNGNVSIYGSVHIVGDYVLENPDLTPSGAVGIYNDYVGNNSTGNSNIVGALTGVVADTNVDLCTRVKMKNRSLFIHGSSTVGAVGHDIYSVNLGNGNIYRGKDKASGSIIDSECDSDNNYGASNQKVVVKQPTDCNTPFPRDYFPTYDLEIPELDPAFPNDVADAYDVTACAEFNAAVDAGGVLRLPPPSTFTCTNGDNEFSWRMVDGVNRLVVAGDINIMGTDVSVDGDIEYLGIGRVRQGTTFDDSARKFDVIGSVRPYGGNYPTMNVLGLETSGSLTFTPTASSPVVAMIAYAREQVIFKKQVIVVGAVVTNKFSVEDQVPKIAYHPEIRSVAEDLGMVGSCQEEQCNPGILADISVERRDLVVSD